MKALLDAAGFGLEAHLYRDGLLEELLVKI